MTLAAGATAGEESTGRYSARTVTQMSSPLAATPVGRYAMSMRVRSFVFGSIRHSAPSRGVVAQMLPAPAATSQTPTSLRLSRVGREMVEGLLGPGAANNSTRGGDLIPTLAFGIPGSGSMALLLGAMLIVGLNPGPEMLKSRLDVTFSMVWVLIISNIIVAGLCFMILNHLAALTFVRGSLLIPFLMFLVFIGSFTANNDLNDIITTLLFGFIGFCMVKFGWPRPPLILGLTLGKIAENYLWISTAAYGAKWLLFPTVLILIAITVVTVAYPTIKERMGKAKYERPEDAM